MKKKLEKKLVWLLPVLALGLAGAGETDRVAQIRASLGPGYLRPADMPDAALFLGPPPAPGSEAEGRDQKAASRTLALRGSPRWDLAISDADIYTPGAPGAFSCAAGFEISPEAAPKTNKLLRSSVVSLGLSVNGVKKQYQRQRPFMVNNQPQCTPDWEAELRKDGSYPSGHAPVGFGWGLILAELVPDRAGQLIARGKAFAESRRVCNVHWQSDVEAGIMAGAATVARLRAEPAFQADLAAARQELADPAVRGRKPARDCAAEAAAIGTGL